MFVLAMGGIENARLLLLSNEKRAAGLGNEHDLVGRFFMEHPHFMSGVLRPKDPTLFTRDDAYFPHLRRNTTVQGKLALREEVLRRERLRNVRISLHPTWDSYDKVHRSPAYDPVRVLRSTLRRGCLPCQAVQKGLRILMNTSRLIRHLASRTAVQILERIGRSPSPVAYRLHHFSEQAPNPNSRVRLSRTNIDPHGQPSAELDLQFTSGEVGDVLRGHELIKDEIEQKGLGVLEGEVYDRLPPVGLKSRFHHMGTTRMHNSARWGVVDANSRVYGLENLYIAGSSVFPTGGYANPALTICALSIRLADHIKAVAVSPFQAQAGAVPN